jgi:hypothetical protein
VFGDDYTSLIWAAEANGGLGMFVGVSLAYGRCVTSLDGVTWTESGIGTMSRLRQVCYNPALALFCIAGENGYIGTSPDAITWTTRICPVRSEIVIWSVASLESKGFTMITNLDSIFYSPDGINWQQTVAPFSVQANAKTYYSAGLGGVIIPTTSVTMSMIFTNDGTTFIAGHGIAPSFGAFQGARHDPVTDSLIFPTTQGCSIMPRSYDPATQFVLPLLANTWIRAT